MTQAAQSNLKLSLVPLRETGLLALEELFDEQCEEWLSLLGWDYSGPSRLIREVARARDLSGFSIACEGNLIGFAYYTIEGGRCSIGDVYVSRQWRGVGADRELMSALLDEIQGFDKVRRIESQCVGVGNDSADALLSGRGFVRLERHYMMLDLDREPESPVETPAPAGIVTRSWQDEDFSQAARVIHRSYKGEHDSLINSQYRTEQGCADLLTILTDHIWCGDFLPGVSRVAVVGPSGNLAAVLIASRIAGFKGHISQISVHPAHQNRGVGRRLMTESIAELRRIGYDTASLAVTATNEAGFHLYRSLGFRTIHTFPVYYLEDDTR